MFPALALFFALSTAVAAPPTRPAPANAAPVSLTEIQVLQLTDLLRGAVGHGLPAVETAALEARLRAPDRRIEGEAMLLDASARYARALRQGRLPAAAFPPDWAQRPATFDAEGELTRALATGRLNDWLAGLPPSAPGYAELRRLLARYRAIAAAGGWSVLPSGPALKLDAQGDRVERLRARLAAEDPSVDRAGVVFDDALRRALARAQQRYGLKPGGELDAATLAELNVPVNARIEQIDANLERLRWLPRTAPTTRIEVNIASQTLDYYAGGAPRFAMRTVVGRTRDRTPMFSDQVEAIVFNPPWNVPSSIATNEILPKLKRDPGYLKRNRFVVQPGPGPVAQRLQQLPGPESALGLVKFDLPNSFNVYLHDTPTKSAFDREVRALSHGCIRLQAPLEFARLLLADDPQWTDGAIDEALRAGATVRAPLSRPIPIFIGYWTVGVDAEGEPIFRRDLYGWDAKLTAMLARARGAGRP